MGELIQKYKDSLEYKKWKVARFFTLYCDSPTEPNEITEETVIEFEKIFSGELDGGNQTTSPETGKSAEISSNEITST
jgi:hypothetical protein